MAKFSTSADDLKQIEARLDQRLDLLTRAESNLKGLFDALRQQVAAAYPVLDQLNKVMPAATRQAEEASLQTSADQLSIQLHASLNDHLRESIDLARQELLDAAAPIRQQLVEDLNTAVQLAKSQAAEAMAVQAAAAEAHAAQAAEAARARIAQEKPAEAAQSKPEPKPVTLPDQDAAAKILAEMADAFRAESRQTLESLRQNMLDQIDLLKADARLEIEPILENLKITRGNAESQVRAAAEAAHASMQQRAQGLSRSVDEIAAVLEERLSQRVAAMQRRAGDAIASIEPTLQTKVSRALENARSAADAGEAQLEGYLADLRPRLDEQLADADRQLVARLQRMEDHAGSMCGYLEQKLSSQVDELIHRLRVQLQKEIAAVSGAAAPTARIEHPEPPARPSLEVELFVNRRAHQTAA
jgi:hypothetical protein